MDITSFILGFKKGAASGGGGATVDPVYTVTFMSEDGAAVLGQRSVVDGDDCADVVVRGLLETPTKESSAQYDYTYSGWSLTSGGAASASALAAVTEDRTVYAAFTSAVRYYTITYLDDDGTVLYTESLAYGAMPSYIPEKSGFIFNGWAPSVNIVDGNATYSAQWLSVSGIYKASSVSMGYDPDDSTENVQYAAINNDGNEMFIVSQAAVNSKEFTICDISTLEAEIKLRQTPDDSISHAFYVGGKYLTTSGSTLLFYSPDGTYESVMAKGHVLYPTAFPSKTDTDYQYHYIYMVSSYGYIAITTPSGVTSKSRGTLTDNLMVYNPINRSVFASLKNSPQPTANVYIWTINEDGTIVKTATINESGALISNISYSTDGTMIAVSFATASPYVSIYDASTFEKICDLSNFLDGAGIATFAAGYLLFASDTTVRAFTVEDGVVEEELEIPTYGGYTIKKVFTNNTGTRIGFMHKDGIEVWGIK